MTQPRALQSQKRRRLTDIPPMTPMSWVEVDLGAFDHNVKAFATISESSHISDNIPRHQLQRPAMICGVVKKNAYGMGAQTIAHRLLKSGASFLAVYSPQEAEDLINQAVTSPILLFMPFTSLARTDALYRHTVAEKLHLTIHDFHQLHAINDIGQTFGVKIPIHIMIDTGMSRGGFSRPDFDHVLSTLPEYRHVRLAGIYTHFATADDDADFLEQQYNNYESAIAENAEQIPEDVILHVANSCAALRDPKYHLDMIRLGISLWGYGHEFLAPGPVIADCPELKHVVTWLSKICVVQPFSRGAKVGYGCTHTLRRKSITAVVPIGYGDGYPLALSNKGYVRVHPKDDSLPISDCKVLGRVNMDQITIDLTDVEGLTPENAPAMIDAVVEIYSADPEAPGSVPKMSKAIKSHPYELLCRIDPVIPRRYV
ncbi:alanine racemase [Poriferisphaera sp. WC338]|uniref:alanine racemase n=1 Tax=Poriferisphaera sp. WC338 TaxID=3425129 RepID=UPI003D81512A